VSGIAQRLAGLRPGALRALAHGVATGGLSAGSGPEKLAAKLGLPQSEAQELSIALRGLGEGAAADTALQLATETALAVRGQADDMRTAVELVLSGPRATGAMARDTASVFSALVREAREEVLVTGYVAVKAKQLLAPLAEFLDADDSRKATIVLDFKRENDTTMAELLAARKAEEFWRDQWPTSRRRPDLLYDPRSLAMERKDRTSMHAKVVVVDRKVLFVTSANLTPRAQSDNIELGVVVRHEPAARAVCEYFESLREAQVLRRASS
jgi:phosphatidylserine/phosphatidylglycerophosphate/cardiolipin synthase-like enzyme